MFCVDVISSYSPSTGSSLHVIVLFVKMPIDWTAVICFSSSGQAAVAAYVNHVYVRHINVFARGARSSS